MCSFKIKAILFCSHCSTVHRSKNLTCFTFSSWITSLLGHSLLCSVSIGVLSSCDCISSSSVNSWSWDAKTFNIIFINFHKPSLLSQSQYCHIYCWFEAFKIVPCFRRPSSKYHFTSRLLPHQENLQSWWLPVLYCSLSRSVAKVLWSWLLCQWHLQ